MWPNGFVTIFHKCSRREGALANTSNAKLLKSHHSHCNAKATVARDKLAHTMNGIRHVDQEVDCLRLPLCLVLAWEGPSPVGLLQVILSLPERQVNFGNTTQD